MENMLKGKFAIVTGGGGGIGREICNIFSKEGASVAVVDMFLEGALETARLVEQNGGKALAFKTDVTNGNEVRAMVAEVLKDFGQIDILVNNAGAGVNKKFLDSTSEDWDKDIKLNLYGPLNCMHAVLGHMVERKYGKIVTMVSDAGRVGESFLPVYSAAKAGAIGISRAVAKDVGKYGININCVAPGTTRTPRIEARMTPEREAKMIKNYALRRLGMPHDPAYAVTFLASDYSGFITGQVLPVNGGYTTC